MDRHNYVCMYGRITVHSTNLYNEYLLISLQHRIEMKLCVMFNFFFNKVPE